MFTRQQLLDIFQREFGRVLEEHWIEEWENFTQEQLNVVINRLHNVNNDPTFSTRLIEDYDKYMAATPEEQAAWVHPQPVQRFVASINLDHQNLDLHSWALSDIWDGSAAAFIDIGPVTISSANTSKPALYIGGNWPNGLTLTNNGFILGAGGQGGVGSDGNGVGGQGEAGGPAIEVSTNVKFINKGTIGGGGGGGGGGGYAVTHNNGIISSGGGGGGGAGGVGGPSGPDYTGVAGSFNSGNGTNINGGFGHSGMVKTFNTADPNPDLRVQTVIGGSGGNGGGLGMPGQDGVSVRNNNFQDMRYAGGTGGIAGHALKGKSYVNGGDGIIGNIFGTQE